MFKKQEAALIVPKSTALTLVQGIAVVFFVLVALTGGVLESLIVCLVIAVIFLNFLGVFYLFGMTINPLTCTGLMMALGLCVDYNVHILFAYISASQATERNGNILDETTDCEDEDRRDNMLAHDKTGVMPNERSVIEEEKSQTDICEDEKGPTSSEIELIQRDEAQSVRGNASATETSLFDRSLVLQKKKNHTESPIVYALRSAGVPVFHSSLTSAFGAVPLLTVPSALFTTFFKLFFAMAMLGFIHSIVLLPVLLRLFGGREQPLDIKAFAQRVWNSLRQYRQKKAESSTPRSAYSRVNDRFETVDDSADELWEDVRAL